MKKTLLPGIIISALLLFLFSDTNAQSWSLNGNSGTTSSNFLGTIDNKALVFRTKNTERMRILSSGNTGIGTNNPLQKLDIDGNINLRKGFGLYVENHRVFFADSVNLNTFSGNGVGRNNTSGSLNTALGSLAQNAPGNTSALTPEKIMLTEASLFQNTPNPFNYTTAIQYMLPQQYSSAKIIITDNNGKTIKEVNLSGSGKGRITIDASSMASGVYNYSMYVDDKQVQSKKMVLNK